MEIAYAAHTESCTFMLDANGVCRWVVATKAGAQQPHSRQWEKSQHAAARCVGAQYVASLDVQTRGGLLEMPRVGVPMLFARVDPQTARVTLVRTAAILRFETRNEARDDWDSGLRERPQPDDVPETEEEWDVDTRRMRRDEVWHDIDPDPESNEEWEVDTATARVELHPSTLERMRPPSYSSGPRDVYTSAPQARAPAHAMPIPRAAPLPRQYTLPTAPTNKRPTVPPPPGQSGSRYSPGQYGYGRQPATPLPPPPGYAPPRTPPPAPPPRRPASEDLQTPRRATYQTYQPANQQAYPPANPQPHHQAYHQAYPQTYQEMPPPPPRLRPAQPSPWLEQRATIRRAR